jgi:hypothetical protein
MGQQFGQKAGNFVGAGMFGAWDPRLSICTGQLFLSMVTQEFIVSISSLHEGSKQAHDFYAYQFRRLYGLLHL